MARKGENIYKRKDGRWEGRYKIGYDDYGKAKYRSIYGKSYNTVKEKLIKLKISVVEFKNSGKLTVKELFEEWFSAIKIRVKPSTYANYRMKADKHILSKFGGMRYECLTVKMLNDFISEKIKSGLSEKYVSDIMIVFKSMAKYILKIYNFKNIVSNIVLPKSKDKNFTLLTPEQQKQLCSYLQNNIGNTSVCILLSLFTGLRIGEICGLKWSDIDLKKNTITINRTVQRIRSETSKNATEIIIGTPKSRTSHRSIPIPYFIAEILRKYKNNSEYYVLSGSIKVTEPRTMQNRFKAILKKSDLPSVNYHSLRHMFATNCLRSGFDIKTLSEILGHTDIETTLDRYVHSSDEQKIKCMNMLEITG